MNSGTLPNRARILIALRFSAKLNCHDFRGEKQINTMKLKLKASTFPEPNGQQINCVTVLFWPETFVFSISSAELKL